MMNEFLKTIAALRAPDGCPWDRAQTHETLIRYLNEESAEVVEAIIAKDPDALKGELGDLLLQIALHSEIAKEAGHFDFNDVVSGINEKMIRRHPHVFAGVTYEDEAAQKAAWQAIKQAEKLERAENVSFLDDVKASLSGLTVARDLQAKAAKVGFDWDDAAPILAKIEEELDEVKEELANNNPERLQKEIGDLLFAVVNLARHAGIEPETAIATTNHKFKQRFAYIEQHLDQPMVEATLEEMDALWEASKQVHP
ncbi:nucleoside triphosphate pyrophosphohydrolase [Wohlfahrtiimonas chitiniclastica]|uniref:nucleoside triphosphate pyrophosphohydrolase n=1 Tax=Wohlfahrtiimonas chitiniclastica TaxID=400946 RepID=UPI001FEFF30E|nr:nucleoside triphosphate pyrophosphohydrolase [Wohlfahrtiimonas chitiniclastica]